MLSEPFIAAAGLSADRIPSLPDLEGILVGILEAGRAAWPAVQIPTDDFLAYLAARLPAVPDPVEALRGVHAADLYLACACIRSDAHALAALEKLAQATPLGKLDDETRQRLRVRLLVGEEGAPPRIAGYRGRGPLAAWLYVAAARVATDVRRSEHNHQPFDETVAHISQVAVDPELDYLKERYGEVVESALREALAGLSAREANVLRLHFVDGATSTAIARMYKVTRRTVHRWLLDARQAVASETKRLLTCRLDLSGAEYDSLVALVQSQIALGFRDPGGPVDDD